MINDVCMTCLALEQTEPRQPLQNKLDHRNWRNLNDKQSTQEIQAIRVLKQQKKPILMDSLQFEWIKTELGLFSYEFYKMLCVITNNIKTLINWLRLMPKRKIRTNDRLTSKRDSRDTNSTSQFHMTRDHPNDQPKPVNGTGSSERL